MQVFIKTLSQETSCFQVDPSSTVAALKNLISERDGFDSELQRLVYSGICLDNEKTLMEYEIPSEATLHLSLGLLGGKKGKKKQYTTKKKGHHKHRNVKLAVLKFYNIDGAGHITPARKMCPTCGVGIFMAKHFDRLYCGKCGTTFKLEASQIEKKKVVVKKEEAVEEVSGKGGKKAPKKEVKKDDKAAVKVDAGAKPAVAGKEGKKDAKK